MNMNDRYTNKNTLCLQFSVESGKDLWSVPDGVDWPDSGGNSTDLDFLLAGKKDRQLLPTKLNRKKNLLNGYVNIAVYRPNYSYLYPNLRTFPKTYRRTLVRSGYEVKLIFTPPWDGLFLLYSCTVTLTDVHAPTLSKDLFSTDFKRGKQLPLQRFLWRCQVIDVSLIQSFRKSIH